MSIGAFSFDLQGLETKNTVYLIAVTGGSSKTIWFALARLKYRCMSYSQIIPIPPRTCMPKK